MAGTHTGGNRERRSRSSTSRRRPPSCGSLDLSWSRSPERESRSPGIGCFHQPGRSPGCFRRARSRSLRGPAPPRGTGSPRCSVGRPGPRSQTAESWIVSASSPRSSPPPSWNSLPRTASDPCSGRPPPVRGDVGTSGLRSSAQSCQSDRCSSRLLSLTVA